MHHNQERIRELEQYTLNVAGTKTITSDQLSKTSWNDFVFYKDGMLHETVRYRGELYLTGNYEYGNKPA